MKIIKFDNEETWLDARLGRITGSRLKDIIVKRGTKPKKGYYELIAERIALPSNGENAMDRGKRLEEYAIDRFTEQTGKEVNTDLVLWVSDENEYIALSPDGYIGETEAVEVKCLSSASHVEALLTKKVPKDYEEQVIQYFIVNEKLETLYFVFFDPRMPRDFFYLTIHRDEVQEKVTAYHEYQKNVLADIEKIINDLTF